MLFIYYGHRVVAGPLPDFGPDVGNVISPEALRSFLDERRDWSPTTLDEIATRGADLAATRDRYFALTFDDGYLDNLTALLPILEERDLPVSIFITSGFIGGRSEPFEYALAHLISRRAVLHEPGGTATEAPSVTEKSRLYERLRRKLKTLAPAKRAGALAQLQSLNVSPRDVPLPRYLMNWDEVRRLDRHPLVAIGAHTVTHPVLSRLAPRNLLGELRGNRDTLEHELGHEIRCLAYPYGSNNAVVRWAAGYCGFRLALSTEERAVTAKDARRRMALPRVKLG